MILFVSEFGKQLISEGVIVSYEVKDTVIPGKSGGAKFIDKNGRIVLSTDISLQGEIPLDCKLTNTETARRIQLTTVEQVLCDKISVLFFTFQISSCKGFI